MNENIVSVIIPVYNVKPYLYRSVNSVLNQTYRYLQIILVDDGSFDGSGELCDKLKSQDNRIEVIHKKNGGLSSARNAAFTHVRGDFISFVDADDWIDVNMMESLVQDITENKTDISCCGMKKTDGIQEKNICWFTERRILSSEEALDLLIDNTVLTSHVVPKLYRSYLWNNIRFPEGKNFEDIYTMHMVFKAANRISIVPRSFYYYYDRIDSISKSRTFKMYMAWANALSQRREDLKEEKPIYWQKLTSQFAVVFSLGIVQTQCTKDDINIYKNELETGFRELKNKDTAKCVKLYASRKHYIYYALAKKFGIKANNIYNLACRFLHKE